MFHTTRWFHSCSEVARHLDEGFQAVYVYPLYLGRATRRVLYAGLLSLVETR
jgi:hypothetical protein